MNTSSSVNYSSAEVETDHVKTFVFPGKCFEKHIACTFRSGTKFSLYPRSQTVSKTQEGKQNIENIIINVSKNILLFHPILRKLVNESNGTYFSLQKVADAAKATDNQGEFLMISRQYRSILRVCIESFQEASMNEQDGVIKNNLLSYTTIFYSIECIWHLCEFLYIDSIPGDIALPFLLEWVRFHFPCHEKTASEMLENCERGSEDLPEYWDTVIGMIVQGRVDVARALLKLHSEADNNEFKLIDNFLRSMPVYSVQHGGLSVGDFIVSWKHWQAECRLNLANQVFASQSKLELILRLITGEYSAFESIRGNYNSWFDVLGGWVMFTAPWAKRQELGAPAAACAGMRAPGAPSGLDHMVRALLDGDLHTVIHEIQQVSDNGWFATHLTDMLYHCGKLKILDKHQNDVTSRLRDSQVVEYGSQLMEHKSLWVVGLSYLASCGEGLRTAEVLLDKVSLSTEAKALRVIAEANKYGLLGVVQTVCGCMSARHLSAGRLGGALAWALRGGGGGGAGAGGGGAAGAARAAHAALRRYCAAGRLPAQDLLLTAGPALLHADALIFLGKYCEFHDLYKSKDFKKAARLLVSLITSKIVPEYFWGTLLLDTLPLLESDEPIFTSSDTYEIMVCLELRNSTLDTEKASLLRLGLVRNLARTILTEGDDGKVEE